MLTLMVRLSSSLHRSDAEAIIQYSAFCEEVHTFLHARQHARQHGRVFHMEPAIPPATVLSTSQHVEERVLVDRVLALAQTFRTVLVGGSETIVRLAAQADRAIAAPFHFKET